MKKQTYPKATDALKSYGFDLRQIGRSALMMSIGAALVVSVTASADWRVYDSRVESKVNEVKTEAEKINEKLASQNKVGGGDFESNPKAGTKQGTYMDPPGLPSGALNKDRPSSIAFEYKDRCPEYKAPKVPSSLSLAGLVKSTPTAGQSIAEKQGQVCKEIFDTQVARYKYNLMMSELASERFKRLQDIQKQRTDKVDSDNVGELQSNTNKMLALLTLIQIDQQQQKAYNDAYDARINFLQATQERLAQTAVNGNGSSFGMALAGNAAAALVMKEGFDMVKAEKR